MSTDALFYGTKKYHKKFDQLCEPMKQYLGITAAGYINSNQNGEIASLFSNYKWVEKYIEQNYFKQDPGMVHPDNMENGFTFVTASNDKDYKDSLLKGAIEFNFHHGFCYVEKTSSDFTLFYFATDKANNKMVNKIVNEASMVKKLIRNLNKQVTSEFKDLQDNKVDIFKIKGDLFLKQKGIVFNEQHETQQKIQILKNEGLIGDNYFNLEVLDLTRQEINCLRVYMEDYNIKNVARNLKIALTTATSHIENIKQKLNCSNKQELLKTADILVALGKI
ncbi:MAG TPA: helix-turn-helix domain-containing protein [Gammaproteobacteria bacterium]|nr:helix-turn-helix domain-containing protein [Gammaproteobacteria bacterium]